MEDTQVNKTHRHTDIQTGRDLTLPLTYSVCVSWQKPQTKTSIFNDTYEDDDEDDWRREPSYDTEEYPEELRQMHNQQYGS